MSVRRVAVVTQDWPGFVGGGVATLAWVLSEGLADLGVSVEVWTRGGGSREGRARAGRVPVLSFSGRSWRRRGRRHWRRGAAAALARFRPDHIIATTWDPMPGVLEALTSSATSPAVSCFAFGRDVTGELEGARREDQRRSVWADPRIRWITLTDWMGAELGRRGIGESRIRKVAPGVEVPERVLRDARPLQRLLTVGRLVPRKGQDRVLEALGGLLVEHPLLAYDIVGAGVDRARLERLADALGVAGRVQFHGRLVGPDLDAAYARADLFVMPAREEAGGDTEGYGLVYLEAGARGLPVIGGASAGAAEAVEHGRTGLLVAEPADTGSVAETIRYALERPAEARMWGDEARRRVEVAGRPRHFAHRVLR